MKRFLVLIPIFLIIFIGACSAPGDQLDPRVSTFVVQTQTATMWTPTPITPTVTIEPKEAIIVDALNSVLRGADPLEEVLDARFYVTDIGFDLNGNPPVTTTMRIHVECEWVVEHSCTTERAFVVLMHVFEREGVRKKIIEQIPTTIELISVMAFDHLSPIGTMEIRWQDILAFTNGEITGDQLAVRVTRFNP